MPKIFISYRREDSIAYAGRIYDRLSAHFGASSVFMDLDTLDPGVDFVKVLQQTVASCDVLLAVIGRQWLGAYGARLSDPGDFVGREICAALEQETIKVVPILVGGAAMPKPGELPRRLAALSNRHAFILPDVGFQQTLGRLIESLERGEQGRPVHEERGSPAGEAGLVKDAAQDPRVLDRPINLGFDGAVAGGLPHGWFNSSGHVSGVSTEYTIRVVLRDDGIAGKCLMLAKEAVAPEQFGSVMQRFRADFLAGRTIRLEGEIRTREVVDWAGLWLRGDGDSTPNLFFYNMQDAGIRGTTPWRSYRIEARLPPNLAWLNLGIVLSGSGAVWADNLRLLMWTNNATWNDV